MYATDNAPAAYYFKPDSVRTFGDKAVFTSRYAIKQITETPPENATHFVKLGNPESIDFSNAQPIVDNAVVWLARTIMCDEQLRKPMVSKQQLDSMKNFSFLTVLPQAAQIFYGPVKDISALPYQKEVLAIIKYNKPLTFWESFPQASNIIGTPSSYAGLVDRFQVNCTEKKLRIPKIEHFDPQNYLIHVEIAAEPFVPNPGSGFAELIDVACRPTKARAP